MVIGVTGPRPHKLGWGYNLLTEPYKILKDVFKRVLIENNCTEAVTGMALGTDMVFAMAVIELKNEGYDIKLHCAIPCKNHSKNWISEDDIMLYDSILSQADIVKFVSDTPYTPYCMEKRNKYIVDISDKMVCLYINTGGTANCLKYAKKKEKEVICIFPSSITEVIHIEQF